MVGLPAAFILRFLLLPLWNWVERQHGIESVGHSGPAKWCFIAVYAILGAALLFLIRKWSR